MREMMRIIEEAYDNPVDIEFTANFGEGEDGEGYRINLVQCRPLQLTTDAAGANLPTLAAAGELVLEASGAVIGKSRQLGIDRVIYVMPKVYGLLPMQDRYAVARLIGRVLRVDKEPRRVMLLGPGRWGTTMPMLGVPVSFAEIDKVAVLCEIVAMRENLVPDVSLGTHFFNDLVEWDMLYLALFPGREGNQWRLEFFEQSPNRLADLVPEEARWAHAVKVIDPADDQARLTLWASSLEQKVFCYLGRDNRPEEPTALPGLAAAVGAAGPAVGG